MRWTRHILLHQDPNFEGKSERIYIDHSIAYYYDCHTNRIHYHVRPNECVNLSIGMKNKVTSINTLGECVYLWYQSECKGSYARIAPGTRHHHNFNGMKFEDNNDRNLNDNTESISRCSSLGKILNCGL